MKFSENWLREWVDPPVGRDELVERLTMTGFPVDSVVAAAPDFTAIVVADVVAVEAHPHAERLVLCRVNDGSEVPCKVVCGAPNVRPADNLTGTRPAARYPPSDHADHGTHFRAMAKHRF